MFSVAWGVFATAFGWIVATDVRGAAHRFHALTSSAMPFGGVGSSLVGVGFLRLLAGVFALAGPVVLVSGLMGVWHGQAGSNDLTALPAGFVVAEATIVGVALWRAWRSSGVLRREWDAGNGLRRTAVAVLTASTVAFAVTMGFGRGNAMTASWLAGGLCGLTLLLGGRPAVPGA